MTRKPLLRISDDPTLTLARFILAVIFLGHGTQKTFGWFGGMGFDRSLDFVQTTMSIPPSLTI